MSDNIWNLCRDLEAAVAEVVKKREGFAFAPVTRDEITLLTVIGLSLVLQSQNPFEFRPALVSPLFVKTFVSSGLALFLDNLLSVNLRGKFVPKAVKKLERPVIRAITSSLFVGGTMIACQAVIRHLIQ